MDNKISLREIEITIAEAVVDEFERKYGKGESRGACRTIAELIAERIGGTVVAGYIRMVQGDAQHYWVEKDGEVIDPLAEKWMDKPFNHISKKDDCLREKSLFKQDFLKEGWNYICFGKWLSLKDKGSKSKKRV